MSDTFENVTIIKKANVYFGGQVTSRTVQFADGAKKTLGFMQAGNYEFGTEALSGWKSRRCDECKTGQQRSVEYLCLAFEVEGNSKFSLPEGGADYCCILHAIGF